MPARLSEFFGYQPLDPAGLAYANSRQCPFLAVECLKPKLGGCSLEQISSGIVMICPNRLHAENYKALADIAEQAFGPGVTLTRSAQLKTMKASGTLTGKEIAVFGKNWGSELSIPKPNTEEDDSGGFYIDYVLARVTTTGEVAEFTAVEVQAIDTTGTYRHEAQAYFSASAYAGAKKKAGWSEAGLNWANVSKRIIPQLIYKGYVLRREKLCGKGLFFLCPTAVLKRVRARLGTKMLEYPIAAGTITFQAYDLGPAPGQGSRRLLQKGETFTTTVEQVAYAFVSPVNLPEMGVYEKAIKDALLK
jgi:hypothetical protein